MKGGVVSERKKGHWSLEEDLRLIQVVTKHGEGRWTKLAKAAGLRRCGKSCRLRWLNYLRPDLKRGNISEEEEVLITDLQSVYGNRWSMIALHLPGRSDNEIKNYWRSHTKKTMKLQQYNAIHRQHAMDFTKSNNDNDGFHQQYDTLHCQTPYFTNNNSDTTIAMHGIQQVASTTSPCCLSNDVDVSLAPPDDVTPHPSIIAGPSLWHLRHRDHDDVTPFINVSSPPPMNTSHSSSNGSHTNPNKTLPTTTTITNPNTTLPTTTTTITTTTLDYFSNEANNTMSDWEIESILEVHSTMHDYDDSQISSDLWVFNDELYNHVPAPKYLCMNLIKL